MIYEVRFVKSTQKELKKLPQNVQIRLLEAIKLLSKDPRSRSVRLMIGTRPWRLRVGSYRVVYNINDGVLTILILRASHRKDV